MHACWLVLVLTYFWSILNADCIIQEWNLNYPLTSYNKNNSHIQQKSAYDGYLSEYDCITIDMLPQFIEKELFKILTIYVKEILW
jgi:hypothetical protein